MPGFYEIGVPNVCLASSPWTVMSIQGFAGMVPVKIEVDLTAFDLTTATQKTNVVQWLGTAVTCVAGVPRINVPQWLGTAVTAATGGIPDVNTKNYNNVAAATDANNYPKVDLVDIAGVAVSTTSAQLGVNTVQYNAQTAATDANNYPKVDVVDWAGAALSAPNIAGKPVVDVIDWLGTAVTSSAGGPIVTALNHQPFNVLA